MKNNTVNNNYIVKRILGSVPNAAGVRQVLLEPMSEDRRAIIRNVYGNVIVGDVIVLLDQSKEEKSVIRNDERRRRRRR